MKKSIYSLVVASVLAVTSVIFSGCSFEFSFGDESSEESSVSKAITETTVSEEVTEEKTAETFAETITETETEGYPQVDNSYVEYHFRSEKQLNEHFEKHGAEFDDIYGFKTAEEYEKGASDVINNDDSLYKTEADDGDGIFYLESTNEIVFLSTDGFIRSYFRPSAKKDYFDRQ